MNNLPDPSRRIIGDVQRAVGSLRNAGRTAIRGATGGGVELVGEYLILARGLAVVHRLKDDPVPVLRLRRPIPRSVKSDECAVLVFPRKHRTGVEHQPIRGPGSRKPGPWAVLAADERVC